MQHGDKEYMKMHECSERRIRLFIGQGEGLQSLLNYLYLSND